MQHGLCFWLVRRCFLLMPAGCWLLQLAEVGMQVAHCKVLAVTERDGLKNYMTTDCCRNGVIDVVWWHLCGRPQGLAGAHRSQCCDTVDMHSVLQWFMCRGYIFIIIPTDAITCDCSTSKTCLRRYLSVLLRHTASSLGIIGLS